MPLRGTHYSPLITHHCFGPPATPTCRGSDCFLPILSFTPGFSPVMKDRESHRNRFNGFSVSFAGQVLRSQSRECFEKTSKPLKRLTVFLLCITGLKPGVNERCRFHSNYRALSVLSPLQLSFHSRFTIHHLPAHRTLPTAHCSSALPLHDMRA